MPIRLFSQPHIYEIKNLLGESPLSKIYLAERFDKNLKIKQAVVLKIFIPKEYTLPRLQIESLLRSQHSPHLVKIMGFEYIQKQPTLILEYIHGVNLKQLLEETELSHEEKAYICFETLQGLKELKQIKLAHGDLSLSNILIDYTGQVRLIDYGLANYKSSHIYGTQPFIAPEINSSRKPNFLSDLFSLGVLDKILNGNFLDSELIRLKNFHFIHKNDCLLNIHANKRKEKPFLFSKNAKYTLGNKVNKILFVRQQINTIKETLPFSGRIFQKIPFTFNRFSKKNNILPLKHLGIVSKLNYFFYLSCLFLGIIFSANPFTSYGQYIVSSPDFSEILIRTQKWVYIDLAGKKGYSPLNIAITQPGTYKIKWKTQNQIGEKKIYLTSRQKIILKDNDFQ